MFSGGGHSVETEAVCVVESGSWFSLPSFDCALKVSRKSSVAAP